MITVDFKRVDIRSNSRILDIGSGPGRHTCAAARFSGVTAIGADISVKDVKEAHERLTVQQELGECNGRWAVLAAGILQLPFDDEVFDLVICAEVLEHLADHNAALSEVDRVLKPGGELVVSVPRFFPEKICWLLSDAYHNTEGGHLRIYRIKSLVGLLETHGLELRGYHYAHSLHSPYWWLKCLVGPTRAYHRLVNLYHRFLVWDLMTQPRISRVLDTLLNPLVGKSLVIYLKKKARRS
jgi:SAM-dependent methyltransferase